MKNYNRLLALLVCAYSFPAMADPTFYGRAYITLEQVNQDDGFTEYEQIELVNNASRIGVKGSETIQEGLNVVYQLEYEAFFDDARTFTQRNIYVGLEGAAGRLIGGHFDTPLKNAQNKVDVFGDLRGDIKNMITPNENRESNSVMYTTPKLAGFTANVAHIASEEEEIDNGISLSAVWQNDYWYFAVAADQDVEEEYTDAQRLVVQYNYNNIQVGALYESHSAEDRDREAGWLLSGLYQLSENWTAKAQYGQSDILYDGGDTLSIGLDYAYTKKFRTLMFITHETSDDDLVDNTYLAVGMDYSF